MDVYVNLRFFPNPREIGEAVARWEELGVAGVVIGDHIFNPTVDYRSPAANGGMDQMTILTVIATLSERLKIGTVAANAGFQHPLFLIRKFAQLAVLYGSERVYAGFGAGWARREFEAIGLTMPPHSQRLDRLEETLRLARTLFEVGYADLAGAHVVADQLPLGPKPDSAPKLLVGGGSTRLLELAGRYCDHIDLNAPSHVKSKIEPQRKLMTTVADLEGSLGVLRDAEAAAGRPAGSVATSVVITDIAFCRESEIEAETERICRAVQLEQRSLLDSPFALLGEPQRMASALQDREERLGLDWIAIPFSDVERFYVEVAPLLT
jgi:alkanesulfonate monooxygenase SsuD/methylene tetrahydromethanopterin reductase-like flavin-dependent oxidoreductase (luciferase family)